MVNVDPLQFLKCFIGCYVVYTQKFLTSGEWIQGKKFHFQYFKDSAYVFSSSLVTWLIMD